MTTLTAPRQSTPSRPQTSTFVIAGVIVVILAVAALVIPRLTSSSSTTTTSHAVTVYKGGGGGNASHHTVRGNPGLAGGFARAVAAERVVAMQRQYLDGLLFQQTRFLDQGTPQAMRSLNGLAPQIAAAKAALDKAEKSVPVTKAQPQTHSQN
jgi:hypothetical protein